MKRIIDVNLNRATEALRILEEIARFILDDEELTSKLKLLRHELTIAYIAQYDRLLESRNTEEDVGREVFNPSEKLNITAIYRANFKRLQQALRTLAEYSPAEIMSKQKGFSDLGKPQMIEESVPPSFPDIESANVGVLENRNANSLPTVHKIVEKIRYESYTLEKKMFEELTRKYKKNRLEDKRLYLVTDRSQFTDNNAFLDAVAASLEGGVQILQLREKTATAKEFTELARRVKQLCAHYETIFIINDRIDIALAIGADGVHLGQDDIDIASARKILGNDAIIGLSTHSPEQGAASLNSGADYIGVGPVYTTPTKPGRASVGIDYVSWAAKNATLPWFAIGGINLDNASEVVAAGASRIAVVRAIINSDSPKDVSNKFMGILTPVTSKG